VTGVFVTAGILVTAGIFAAGFLVTAGVFAAGFLATAGIFTAGFLAIIRLFVTARIFGIAGVFATVIAVVFSRFFFRFRFFFLVLIAAAVLRHMAPGTAWIPTLLRTLIGPVFFPHDSHLHFNFGIPASVERQHLLCKNGYSRSFALVRGKYHGADCQKMRKKGAPGNKADAPFDCPE
jgi:hypothetical protein